MFSTLNQIIKPFLPNTQGHSVNPSHSANDKSNKEHKKTIRTNKDETLSDIENNKDSTKLKDITTFSVDALRAYILKKENNQDTLAPVNNNIPNAIQAYIRNDHITHNHFIKRRKSSKKKNIEQTLSQLDNLEKSGVHHITIQAEETFTDAIENANSNCQP